MNKVIVASLAAAAALVGVGSSAQAGHRNCEDCGPLPTVHSYSHVNRVSHVTHYSDVYKTHYFDRPQYFDHVTVTHPVVYVNNVTRVHHEYVPVVRPVYRSFSEMVAPRYVYSSRVVNIDEGCCCQ